MERSLGIVPASLQATSAFYAAGGNVTFDGQSYLYPPFDPAEIQAATNIVGVWQSPLGKPAFYPHLTPGANSVTDVEWWSASAWTYVVTDSDGVGTFSFPDGLPVKDAVDLARHLSIDGACDGIDDISFYAKAMWLNSFTFDGMRLSAPVGSDLVPEFSADGPNRQWFDSGDVVPEDLLNTTYSPTRESSVATGLVAVAKDAMAVTGGGREVSPVEITGAGKFEVTLGGYEADPLPQGQGVTPEPSSAGASTFRVPIQDNVVYMQFKDMSGQTIIDEYFLQGAIDDAGTASIWVDKTYTTTGYLLPGIYTGVAYTSETEYYSESSSHTFDILIKSEYTYNLSTPSVDVDLDSLMEDEAIAAKASQVGTLIDALTGTQVDEADVDLPSWETYYPVLVGAVSARNLTYTLEQPDPGLAWMEYQNMVAGEVGDWIGIPEHDFYDRLMNLTYKGGLVPDTLDESEFYEMYDELYPETDGLEVDILVNGVSEWSTSIPMPSDASYWEAFALPLDQYADWRFVDLDSDGTIEPDEWVSGQIKIDTNDDDILDTWIDQPLNISIHVSSVANYTDKEFLLAEMKLIDGSYDGHQEWNWIDELDDPAGNVPISLGIFDHATGVGGSFTSTDLDGASATFSCLLVNTTREGPTYGDIIVKDVTIPLWAPFIDHLGKQVVSAAGAALYGEADDDLVLVTYISSDSLVPRAGDMVSKGGLAAGSILCIVEGSTAASGQIWIKPFAGVTLTNGDSILILHGGSVAAFTVNGAPLRKAGIPLDSNPDAQLRVPAYALGTARRSWRPSTYSVSS